MSNKAKNDAVAIQGGEPWSLKGAPALLHWAAVVLAVAALVCSLFPWVTTPSWLLQLDDLTSTRLLALDMGAGYGPMNFADLATTFNNTLNAAPVVWLLGGAEALWVASLTFIVLASGGSLARRPFDEQQLRRFVIWGAGFMVMAAVLTLIFLPISAQALESYFFAPSQNIAGYVAYVGGAGVVGQGFGAALWLWFSLGCGIAALVCGIAQSVMASRSG